MFNFGSLDRKRRKLAHKAPEGPLRHYLSTALPDPSQSTDDLKLLAIDLETTGLAPRSDSLLSVGFVPVDGDVIDLRKARQIVVRQAIEVGQSATLHGVTDDVLAGGVELAEAVAETLEALSGRVMLAHHAGIEVGFLSAACRTLYGAKPVFSIVDTLQLQARIYRVDPHEAPYGTLRLAAARSRFGLPRYRAHHALTDALACAELYLAQVGELGSGEPMSLRALQRS